MSADPSLTPRRVQTAWVIGSRLLGVAATFATNVIAARWLGPADFGAFLLLTTVMAVGSLVAMGGLNEAGLRFVSENLALGRPGIARAYMRRIFLIVAVTSSITACGVTACSAYLLRGTSGQWPWLIAFTVIGVVVLAWQQLAAELLRAWQELRLASLFSGGQTGGPLANLLLLFLLGCATFCGLKPDSTIAVGLTVLVIGVTLPLALIGLWRITANQFEAARELERKTLNRSQKSQLLAAAAALLAIQILTFAIYQLDLWIGGALLTSGELGLFGAAKRCQLIAQLPMQMAMLTVIASVPRLHAQTRLVELEHLVRRASSLAAVPAVMALAALVIAPRFVLGSLFGGAYVDAAQLLWPLAIGQLIHVLFGNPAYVLTMTGHHALVLRINVFATAVILLSGFIGAATLGAFGLAMGSSVGVMVQNGLLWWFARRHVGIWTHVRLPNLGLDSLLTPLDKSPWLAHPEPMFANIARSPQDHDSTETPVRRSPPRLTRLWWLHPAWPFAGIVAVTMVAAWWQSDHNFQLYGSAKYIQPIHVIMAFSAIAAFVVGARLGETTTGKSPSPSSNVTRTLIFWFLLSTALTIGGYVVWIGVGFRNGFSPSMFPKLLLGDDSDLYNMIRRELFPTIPGITTCTQFGVAAIMLGAWLFIHREHWVIWPITVVVVLGGLRAILFSERTALLELIFPLALIAIRSKLIGRAVSPRIRQALFSAPILGALGLVGFFAIFEYVRSWQYYQNEFHSYADFTLWRLSGYFTTAHNNGAMALATNQPRPLPYFTLRPVWEFPGLRHSPLGYEELTGVDVPEAHFRMLEQFGTVELNNEGGLFQPAIDFGWGGFLLYWFGYGFLSTRLYRSFLAGSLAGITLYPLVYMSLLEVPLILFLFYTRTFPPLMMLLLVVWLARRNAIASRESRAPAPLPGGALSFP